MFRRFYYRIISFFRKSEPVENKPIDINPAPEIKPIDIKPINPDEEISGPIYGVKAPNFEELYKLARMDTERAEEIATAVSIYIRNKHRYDFIARSLGGLIPSYFIFALHYRESSLSFSGVLHNGEEILGTGKVTRLVPKGRGPFDTWEESAIDALMIKNYHKATSWTIAECLERSERFNGLGYRSKIGNTGKLELSPYVWAGTNLHDENSKYTSDGKYSPTAKESQLGVAALYLGLGV